MSDQDTELRQKLLGFAQNNFDDGEYITDSQDWRRFLDDVMNLLNQSRNDLLDDLEKELPEVDENIDDSYTPNSAFGQAIYEVRNLIASKRNES